MNSRPLLDYLAFPEEFADRPEVEPPMAEGRADPLEARLRDLEARLRASQPAAPAHPQDLTLSAQIEAILRRKAAAQPAPANASDNQPAAFRHAAARPELAEPSPRLSRVAMDPPPSVPAANDVSSVDQDFVRFTEAVYLIGQAARRFIEEPQLQAPTEARPAPRAVAAAPSAGEIEALSAVLRETVSAFRSVADDLAVSAGEIRHYATRAERQPERPLESRRSQPARHRDEDEILELRENIADLQIRLDDLLHARRRARY